VPFLLASRHAAVKLSTYSFISAAHSHTNLCPAGSPSTTPHIPKAVAKDLNKELQQCGWIGTCLSEKIHGVKVSVGSLASWDFPDSTAQPTLFSHSLILLFCQNCVLPQEEWLSAADAAFDKVFSACSTSLSLSPSQLLTQLLKVFADSKICVSTQPDSGTQANVNLTQLCTEEAEVLLAYQPVAEDTADAVILVIEQERVTMVEDPYSESAAQHRRHVTAVRVPRHRWLYCVYDTGELLSLQLLWLPRCADIKQNNNCCLAWQHALIDPQLVHAFAGDPKDAISRKL